MDRIQISKNEIEYRNFDSNASTITIKRITNLNKSDFIEIVFGTLGCGDRHCDYESLIPLADMKLLTSEENPCITWHILTDLLRSKDGKIDFSQKDGMIEFVQTVENFEFPQRDAFIELSNNEDIIFHHYLNKYDGNEVDEIRQGDDIVPELLRLARV